MSANPRMLISLAEISRGGKRSWEARDWPSAAQVRIGHKSVENGDVSDGARRTRVDKFKLPVDYVRGSTRTLTKIHERHWLFKLAAGQTAEKCVSDNLLSLH